MITVLCANAGLDKTFEVPGFTLGGFHHPRRVQTSPGGKGINVARALRALGHKTVVSGFAGGTVGRTIAKALRREGVTPAFTEIGEESRLCVNIADPKTGKQTRVDEVGPLVTPTEIAKLRMRWRQLIARSSMVIISGSAPRGVPFDLYAELILASRKRDVVTILDAHDEMLRDGVQAAPTVVKPNLAELSTLFEKDLSVPDGVLAASRELLGVGVQMVICSLAAGGAIVTTRDHGEWRAHVPPVQAVSPVGCGDALVAGFASATVEGREFQERIKWGVAAGSACAGTLGAGLADRLQIEGLVPLVRISRPDEPLRAPAPAPDPETLGEGQQQTPAPE